MTSKKQVVKKVQGFLKDPHKKKIEIKVPKDFSLSWVRNSLVTGIRKVMLLILTKVPPMKGKTWLFRTLGYDFGKDVCLPGFIDIDPYFPELITLEDGVLVGGGTRIKPWKLEKGVLTLGRIHCDRRVLLAGWTRLFPGALVHENTITGIRCLVDEEIPKDSFVIKHNKVIKTWSKEEVERHFGESTHDPEYAKKVRHLTTKFRKDPELRRISFRNDGDRLNAGCDWWRARPVWQIYLKGAIMELSILMPWEGARKFLLRLFGVKFGSNFRFGKNVLFDHIYGDKTIIGDNVTMQDNCWMDGHEYTASETVYGKTVIGNNVLIKEGSWIRGGVTIGDNAVIEKNTDIMKDVGEGETWAGSPAKLVE